MIYKITKGPGRLHVDFENGPIFRAIAYKSAGQTLWTVQKWDFVNGIYNDCTEAKTANDAIRTILVENA